MPQSALLSTAPIRQKRSILIRRMFMFRSLAPLLILLLPSLPVLAQTSPPLAASPPLDQGAAGQAEIGPVAKLIAALQLQAKGEQTQDAMALAQAAQMAAEVQIRAAIGWAPQSQTSSAPPLPADAAASTAPGSLPPAALLAFLQSGEAMAALMLLAEDDDALDDVMAPLAGANGWYPTGAVTQAEAELPSGMLQEWLLPFDGQSPAEVSVLTLSPGAALWQVQDEAGGQICPPQSAASALSCSFTPEVNSYFRILVDGGSAPAAPAATATADSNSAALPLRYLLLTN